MISIIGNSLLLLFFGFNSYILFSKSHNFFTRRSHQINLLIILLAFITLLCGFIVSDFSIKLIYENSHSSNPLKYRIAATIGNHEGSILIFCLILNLVYFIFTNNIQLNKIFTNNLRFFNSLHNFLLIAYIFFTSNPFKSLPKGFDQGLGFNSLLQNDLVLYHPPILYFGYASCFLIASYILAMVKSNNIDKIIFKKIYIINLFAIFTLTFAIALGSYWAYNELGWGGYWFWDPVENISLIPWMISIILLHNLIILLKKNIWYRSTIMIGLSGFLFAILGFLLVRSGILFSVHSFANDPSRASGLLIIMVIYIFLISKILKNSKLEFFEKDYNLSIKIRMIILNNLMFISVLSIILLSLFYPIIYELITLKKLSIGAEYFNVTIQPFLVVSLIALFISLMNKKYSNVKVIIISLTYVIILLVSLELFKEILISIIFSISLLILLIINFKLIKSKTIMNYKNISHASFVLLILAIILNYFFKSEHVTTIKLNEEITINNIKLRYDSFNYLKKENYLIFKPKITINHKNMIYELFPEKRLYLDTEVSTSETAIKREFFHDIYLLINNYDDNTVTVRLYQNKFINLIWFSVLLMLFGILLRIYDKKHIN